MSSTKENGGKAKESSAGASSKKSTSTVHTAKPSRPTEGGTRTFDSAGKESKKGAETIKKSTSVSKGTSVKSGEVKKRRKKKTGLLGGFMKFIVYMVCVIGISVLLSAVIINLANDMFAFVKDEAEVSLEIPENATTSEISALLKKNGIIKYPTVFKLYTDFKKNRSSYYTDGYKKGSFELSSAMNYDTLISTLSNNSATREIVRLTFPEGSTIDEIIDILIKGGIKNTKEQYVDVIQNYEFNYRFVKELDVKNFKEGRKYRLEGYLFPDTYDFYTDASPAAVIDKFLVNFNNKFDSSFYDRANKLEMTVDDIINIASLIEKESKRSEDSGYISSVFHNRLNNKAVYPYLQSDATVQYAFKERKSTVTPEDLKLDTPYNTYLYKGLPPSAIANPGLDAITNALYPESSSYYFFIANSKGETLFAKTLDGHNANIAMIQKEKAQ